MRNILFASAVLSSFTFVVAACSVESTSPPSSSGTDKPTTTIPATEPKEDPSSSTPPPAKTSEDPKQDPPPKTPPKPFFDATLDGDAIVFDETSITFDDGDYELQGTVKGATQLDSDSTLTVHITKGETGAGLCDGEKRSVDLWYEDEQGTIRGIGTSYQYGNCSMTLDTSIAGYISGQAQGTLGGAKQKTFSVKFAQKLP